MDLSAVEFPGSPFVWLTYRLPGDRKKRYFKTRVRKDAEEKVRKVALAKNDFERKLLLSSQTVRESASDWGWVEPWLSQKYRTKARTLAVYRAQWDSLSVFLDEEGITHPTLLDRDQCYEYTEWRTGQVKKKSGKNPSINTALGELKLLGMVLAEAKNRGYVTENVCLKLGISREETDLKPEIEPDQEAIIVEALKKLPAEYDWMLTSFTVAILTALRFADTRLARAQIRWQDDEILIERPKGGRRREFAIPIYETLRPLLHDFRKSGRSHIWTRPANQTKPYGMVWRDFFDGLGMHEVCFHCTRVTFITRGMRAGVPEPVMMKMVNHGSKLVSRVYQRWAPKDVRDFAARIEGQAAAAAIADSR